MNKTITMAQHYYLRRLSAGYPDSRITNPTGTALEKRGLTEWVRNPARPWGGEWNITDAGRAAISPQTSKAEG
jgi:hypothetical protein